MRSGPEPPNISLHFDEENSIPLNFLQKGGKLNCAIMRIQYMVCGADQHIGAVCITDSMLDRSVFLPLYYCINTFV